MKWERYIELVVYFTQKTILKNFNSENAVEGGVDLETFAAILDADAECMKLK